MISPPASLQPAKVRCETSARPSQPPKTPGIATNLLCDVGRRAYRWSRFSLRLGQRVNTLRARLGALPRKNVGVLLKDIDPAMEERVRPLRQIDRELVIGDFDQDGGIVSRFGPMDGVPSIASDQFMARTGFPVLLVDLNGRLGVRKEFRSYGRFVQEIEALLDLDARGCPVPHVMNVDWYAHALTITFVPGRVVREMLAQAGADIRDRTLEGAYTRSIDKERIRRGREVVPRVLSDWQISRIAAGLAAIHEAGFVLEDVKYGNIVLNAHGEPVFIDLERALPVDGLPRALADHLRAIDLRKFRDHFGERQ